MKIKKSFEKQEFILSSLSDLKKQYLNPFREIRFKKPNDEIWFELWKTSKLNQYQLYCEYDKVWGIFEKRFNMNDNDIINFIKIILSKYTNWKVDLVSVGYFNYE